MTRLCLLVLLLSLSGGGQASSTTDQTATTHTSKKEGNHPIVENLPVRQLQFGTPVQVEAVEAYPAMLLPIPCTADGTAFLAMLVPPSARTEIYAIRGKQASVAAGDKIPELRDVVIENFFPSETEIAFLVRGTPLKETADTQPRADTPQRPQSSFAAIFDRSGKFKQLTALPANMSFSSIGILNAGDLIVAGLGITNQTPRLLILSSDGKIERAIDQPLPAAARSGGFSSVLAAAATQFVSHGDQVLAWRVESNDPVLEIGPGPAVREVRLTLPKGAVISDMLSSGSKDPWIVHAVASKSEQDPNHSITDRGVYYELSALDGSLIRELKFSDPSIGALACKISDHYVSFNTNDKKQLLEYRAQ